MDLTFLRYVHNKAAVSFLQKGDNPKIFLISGIHGDESSVIEPVRRCVEKFYAQLPDFIYIPQACPSALKVNTRGNKEGVDINRCFFPDTKEAEAQVLMKLLESFKFQFGVTFHEDSYQSEFYMYDSSGNLSLEQKLEPFLAKVKRLGIPLLNGYDDEEDPQLGFEFKDGYRSFPNDASTQFNGMLEVWAVVSGVAGRVLNPETPTSLPAVKKLALIEVLFQEIIIPLGKEGTQHLR